MSHDLKDVILRNYGLVFVVVVVVIVVFFFVVCLDVVAARVGILKVCVRNVRRLRHRAIVHRSDVVGV